LAGSKKKKSSKRKTGGKKNTGIILASLALIASLGALGLGLFQFFIPPGAPQIYSLYYEDIIYIDGVSIVDYLYELELTYKAKAGDRILLEFSCELYINPSFSTSVSINFDIGGTIYPTSRIYVLTSDVIYTSGYMRHYIESSDAGEFDVIIYASMSEEFSTSFIRHCLLTITVN